MTGAGQAQERRRARHRIHEDRCIRRGAARAGMIARIASPAVRRTGHRPALSSQAR